MTLPPEIPIDSFEQNARETILVRDFFKNQDQDGFYDFKVYIRLLILEIKLELYPCLPSLSKQYQP